MNRRKFLATLFGAGAAIAAGPTLLALVPTPAPPPLPPPLPPVAVCRELGISVRFIRSFDAVRGRVDRFDVLYGMPATPQFACRVMA